MAVALRAGSFTTSIGIPTSIANATGHAAGDIIVIVAGFFDLGTTCSVTGFTSIDVQQTINAGQYAYNQLFWKLDGGSEPSGYSYSCSSYCDFFSVALTGCNTTTPIAVSNKGGGVGTYTVGSVSVPAAGCFALFGFNSFSSTGYSTPDPLTKIGDRGDTGFQLFGQSVSAGTLGPLSVNGSSADANASVLAVFQPPGGSSIWVDNQNVQPRQSRRIYSFGADSLPPLSAAQLSNFSESGNPQPERYPFPRIGGVDALAGIRYAAQVEANPATEGWKAPPNRDTTNEPRPLPIAASTAKTTDVSNITPERYPALRADNPMPLSSVYWFPQVEATQPIPRSFALLKWAFGGAEAIPADRYVPQVEANPALKSSQARANQDTQNLTIPPFVFPAVAEAYQALRGWQAPELRHLAGEPLPLLQYDPEVEAYPALRGWLAPPVRHLAGEPVPATAYVPQVEANAVVRGWQPGPNRDRGAETAPPLFVAPVVVPFGEATQAFPERYPPLRVPGAEPLPAVKVLPQVPETWPYTRAAPPKRDWQGFEPQPAPQLTPFFAWPGMTSPAWRPPLRSFPYLDGAEAIPRVAYVPPSEAPPAQYGWRPGPNRERGAEVAPPLVFGSIPLVSPAPQQAPRATWASFALGVDAPPPSLNAWIATNDAPFAHERPPLLVDQTQAAPAAQLKPWGFEPVSPRQPRAIVPRGHDSDPRGVVVIYHLLPWIWEPQPLWGRRERSKALDTPTGGVLFGFATAHGPLTIVSFANQLPEVNLVGFENQLAEFEVVSFDEDD